MDRNCGNCAMFERGKWTQELGGGEQLGGYCETLLMLLGRTNYEVSRSKYLHVQESFCCSLHRFDTEIVDKKLHL